MTATPASTSDITRFEDGWSSFNEWVSARESGEGKSSMWRGMIADFDLHRGRGLPTDLKSFVFRPNAFRTYGFVMKGARGAGLGLRGALLRATYLVVRALGVIRGKLWQTNIEGFGRTELTGHPAGARELERRGLREGYEDFCSRHDFVPAGYNSMKCYYVASIIREELGDVPNAAILEIGGGVGTLANILLDMVSVRQYLIVDLPEMILNSSIAIRALHPEISVRFLFPGSDTRHDPAAPGIYFCVPEMVDRISPDAFDLALNIDSFQEMTEDQVAGYLTLVQRVVKNGGRFVNLNRRKFLTTEKFDNNPLLYPYAPANRVSRWETDAFMAKTLNLGGVRMDSWMLRCESVQKHAP